MITWVCSVYLKSTVQEFNTSYMRGNCGVSRMDGGIMYDLVCLVRQRIGMRDFLFCACHQRHQHVWARPGWNTCWVNLIFLCSFTKVSVIVTFTQME